MPSDDLLTPFERGNGNQTCTYDECITYYEKLDRQFDEATLLTYGKTSAGRPLHLLVISADGNHDPEKNHDAGKCVLLVNNGIHPGEPDGIDASMMFARDLLLKKGMSGLPANVVVCIVPVYNISGMLNRSSTSRVNQNGPEEFGFRGTAQHYDLNRDFIKCDAPETEAFTEIFQTWKPEIFIDTHVSNGADYQYTMTLIPAQKDKLHPVLSAYQEKTLLPELYAAMKADSFEMTPYVNPLGETPESGIAGFLETPRFSTGYAALFNSIGMMPEAHMLKPYSSRVAAMYHLIRNVMKICARDSKQLVANKKSADTAVAEQLQFALSWKLDDSKSEVITFRGYEAKYSKSEVSGEKRLWYDRNEPTEKQINFFHDYVPVATADKPFAYIVPQGWHEVIRRLKQNGVAMKNLAADTVLSVEVYYTDDFKTTVNAYEGHYLHSAVVLRMEQQQLRFFKGDYVIFPIQPVNRYIVETLEPQGVDSYFAWNFFDASLGMKEYFSDYVFEDVAAELLRSDAKLREDFEKKKKSDKSFSDDAAAQLDFIYRHSPYFEKSFRRYPVARLNSPVELSLE